MNASTPNSSTHLTGDAFKQWRKKSLFLAKRGNLESELLLVKYLQTLPGKITTQKANLFRELLSENDQNLLNWLIHTESSNPLYSTPPPPKIPHKYFSLIKEIRINYLK